MTCEYFFELQESVFFIYFSLFIQINRTLQQFDLVSLVEVKQEVIFDIVDYSKPILTEIVNNEQNTSYELAPKECKLERKVAKQSKSELIFMNSLMMLLFIFL
jgi:hypothetical protein